MGMGQSGGTRPNQSEKFSRHRVIDNNGTTTNTQRRNPCQVSSEASTTIPASSTATCAMLQPPSSNRPTDTGATAVAKIITDCAKERIARSRNFRHRRRRSASSLFSECRSAGRPMTKTSPIHLYLCYAL